MMTPRIAERLRRDYPRAEDHAVALGLVEQIGAELSFWREVSEGDRVEAAALALAAGDVAKLHSAVDLALHDWRDLLVAAGYA